MKDSKALKEYKNLPLHTRKNLEEAGITFEIYEQMFELLNQVQGQMSAFTEVLHKFQKEQE